MDLGLLLLQGFMPYHSRSRYHNQGLSMQASKMRSLLVCFLLVYYNLGLVTCLSQGAALIAIKNSWRANLPSWVADTNPCSGWEGVACNDQGELVGLNLTNKGLFGPVPVEISYLTFLTSLDLSYSNWSSGIQNRVSGDLSAIGSLTNLVSLNLTYNVLNMDFPSAILKLTNLEALRLDNTYLTGPFPKEISNLVNLQYLYLGNCYMTGNLPSEIGNLVNLVELSLWNNPFSSSLPVELSNLAKLTYLNLHNCSLWGGLPSEFGKLKSIVTLHLYQNFFTGSIPDSWQNMSNLYDLRLQYNYLSKNVSFWLLKHPSLKSLHLSHNEFYGSFPNFTNSSLQQVRLECNFLTGPWPVAPASLILRDEGNCFLNVTSANDNSNYLCGRTYSCDGFFQQLSGGCPPCPVQQFKTNATLCICGEATVGNEQNTGPKSLEARKIVGIVLGTSSFLLVIGLLIVFKLRCTTHSEISKREDFFSVRALDDYWEVPKGVRRFNLEELAKVTFNFHKDNEIGMGGFGKVFYGVLEDGKKVAIKRASPSSMQGSVSFRTEVILLSRLHHRNLVRLEGFCEDKGLQILVYEYVTNGNLHEWLFRSRTDSTFDWRKRLDIAMGVAQGLEYLHSFADPPVIHRDVKPSNILLDENLVAKLADFGLSKVTPEFETHVSTMPAGTAGYIDPQYFLRRQLTTASDVYGYGVVLLELITGQKAIDVGRTEELNLIEWAKPRLEAEGIRSIVDPRLGSDFPEQVFEDLAHLAARCASFSKAERPSMQEVVSILEVHMRSCRQLPLELGQDSSSSFSTLEGSLLLSRQACTDG